MNSSGVPSSIQKKIKDTNEYKNGQKKQKKAKKLNLNVAKDITIVIGIFISVVGIAIFAASAISAWGPLLLLI